MARLGIAFLLLLMALTANGAEITGSVTVVTTDYGNLDTDVTYQQLQDLGFDVGDAFVIIHGEKRVTAHFGSTYGDVAKGEWVGMLNGMGNLRLARNFENAAETLGIEVGDAITIATEESTSSD